MKIIIDNSFETPKSKLELSNDEFDNLNFVSLTLKEDGKEESVYSVDMNIDELYFALKMFWEIKEREYKES